ncbi:precorrin-6y C5,15-methyltransferase (decarboxylating) subunit CbiE [Neptuniibacter halophilus]|uniref:precorrin-6y C5,15-methyltransferase (decarboxylating) subunit CbiE n=1 Tax=Neptuniibacter halophilus TaxID=651666 RepID=UPI0025724690|nr:precorrin-6y C5,15-methyltransferase (decarboxylating) subunit CbiE [Neptuniibacter halophilus]
MSELQIDVIGLGVSAEAELNISARNTLRQAEVVIGSVRQLEVVAGLISAQTECWLLPKLSELKAELQQTSGRVVVLASGDPLFYGIGRWFSREFTEASLTFHPAVSSLQAACHRLGLALQDMEVLSLHGRPLEKLKTRLRQQQNLLILTDKNSQPAHLAQLCSETGFPQAQLTVLENLGYPQEQIRRFTVSELQNSPPEFDPLHLTLLEPGENRGYLPGFPGIPDQHFITDNEQPGKGMISKREVRLAILSLLQLNPGERVRDIGAGCGGVAVELAYWQPQAQVDAIEHHPQRLACLEANRKRFGVVSNLNIVAGRAPEAMQGLAPADKVFIGGSDGELAQLLQQVWAQLPERGVLVASAVTEHSKQQLLEFSQLRRNMADAEQETLQLAVSRGETLAGQLLYRPNLPVSLFRWMKTGSEVAP